MLRLQKRANQLSEGVIQAAVQKVAPFLFLKSDNTERAGLEENTLALGHPEFKMPAGCPGGHVQPVVRHTGLEPRERSGVESCSLHRHRSRASPKESGWMESSDFQWEKRQNLTAGGRRDELV